MYDIWKKEDIEQAKLHKHRSGISGASSLCKCTLANSMDILKLEGTPVSEGLKGWHGAFRSGTNIHEELQNKLDEKYAKESNKFKAIAEVYIVVPLTNLTQEEILSKLITNGMSEDIRELYFRDLMLKFPEEFKEIGVRIIVSPIDYAYYLGEVDWIEYEFRDRKETLPFAGKNTEFLRIFDIKSADNFGFGKLNLRHLDGNYMGQFYSYCKGADLKELTVIAVWKSKYIIEEIRVKITNYCEDSNVATIQPKFWDKMISKQESIQKLVHAIRKRGFKTYDSVMNTLLLDEKHLDCLNPDKFVKYCRYNLSHDEYSEKDGLTRVVMDAPCSVAMRVIKNQVIKKYTPFIGTDKRFKRGMSHIKILGITDDCIRVQNKGGKVYEDTFKYALQKYEEVD